MTELSFVKGPSPSTLADDKPGADRGKQRQAQQGVTLPPFFDSPVSLAPHDVTLIMTKATYALWIRRAQQTYAGKAG